MLSDARRRELNARLAEALAVEDDIDLEALVVHYEGAGDRARAGEHALAAADQASRALAFDRAAQLYRTAFELDVARTRMIRTHLGDSLANAGHGDVRELRAHIEQTVTGDTPAPDTQPLVDGNLPLRDARERWVRYFERTYVAELLARTAGNVSAAAALAGVDRVYMHRMITRAGLREQLQRDRK